MADVGVLNLQIHSNADEAEKSLKRLEDALRAVGNAVKDSKLSSTASAIAKIDKAVNSTMISNLNNLASALRNVREASNFTMPNLSGLEKISQAVDKINNASDKAGKGGVGGMKEAIEGVADGIKAVSANAADGFGDMSQRVGDVTEQIREMNSALNETAQSMQRSMESGGGLMSSFQRFQTLLRAMMQMKSTNLLGGGQNPFLLGDGGVAPENMPSTWVDPNPAWKPDWTTGADWKPDWVSQPNRDVGNAIQVEGWIDKTEVNDAKQGFETVKAAMEETVSASESTTSALKGVDRELRQKQTDANGAASGFQNLTNNIQDTCNTANGFSNITNNIGTFIQNIKEAAQKATAPIRKFGNEVWRIIKRMAIRWAIKQITSGIAEGVKNMYMYSDQIHGTFASTMDSAASTLLQFKNSIGAAAAPLIEMLIPAIQSVVNWLISGINYLNQFLALLNGQKTWTRAVQTTTKAYKDQTKQAKKASAAVKDLLADWDELNIIQKESSGGGTSSGTKAAEDYLKMFEEVDKFDKKIRSIVEWIQEHMDLVKTIAEAIAATILAWKISDAFGNTLGFLQTLELAAGITLLITGIKMAADAGYSIGKDGINGQNALEAVGGVLASMIGGGLIGLAFAGIVGGLIGLSIGVSLALIILGLKINEGFLDSLYGDYSADIDTIRNDIETNFLNVDALATVNILDARLKDTQDAEQKLAAAVKDVEKAYPVDVTLTPDNTADFKTKIKTLVSETNAAIEQEKENFKVTVPTSATLTTTQFTNAWDNVKDTVKQISDEIGKTIDTGIKDNVKLTDLKNRLLEISKAVLGAQNRSEFSGTVGLLGSATRAHNFANFDRATIRNYVKEYNSTAADWMTRAQTQAIADLTDREKLVASIKASISGGEGIISDEEMQQLKDDLAAAEQELAAFKAKGIEKVAQEYFDDWTLGGRTQLAQDILGSIGGAMAKNTNVGQRETLLRSIMNPYIFGENNNDIETFVASVRDSLAKVIASESGMDSNEIAEMLGIAGLQPETLFDDKFITGLKTSLLTMATQNGLTYDEKVKLMAAFGFDYETVMQQFEEEAKAAAQGLASKTEPVAKDMATEIQDAVDFIMGGLANNETFENVINELKSEEGWHEEAIQKAIDKVKKELGEDVEAPEIESEQYKWTLKDIVTKTTEAVNKAKAALQSLAAMAPPVNEVITEEVQDAIDYIKGGVGNGHDPKEVAYSLLGAEGWHEDAVIDAIKFLNKTYDDYNIPIPGITSGSMPQPIGYVASAGMSDVSGRPSQVYTNPTTVQTAAEEEQHVENGVQKGVQSMKEDQHGQLNELISLLRQVNNKKWTVMVTPGSDWGRHQARSQGDWEAITGEHS